jgi:hypothetical protein
MTEQLKLTDLPPVESCYVTSSECPQNYSPQITNWPTLLATGAGVVVLVLLFSWFTGGSSQQSDNLSTKKPKARYVSPARDNGSTFDPKNPAAAHEYAKQYLQMN